MEQASLLNSPSPISERKPNSSNNDLIEEHQQSPTSISLSNIEENQDSSFSNQQPLSRNPQVAHFFNLEDSLLNGEPTSGVETGDNLTTRSDSDHSPSNERPIEQRNQVLVGESSNSTTTHLNQEQNAIVNDNRARWRFLNRDALRENWSADDAAEAIMMKAFGLYVYLLITYIFGIIVVNGCFSIYCFFSFNMCICLGQVIRTLIMSRNTATMNQRQKRERYFKCADWLIITIFITVAGYNSLFNNFFLTPVAVLGFLNIILLDLYSNANNSLLTKSTITNMNLLFWAQIILISLKIDGFIDNWTLVFIGLFYVLIFCMAFSIGISAMLLPSLYQNRTLGRSIYPLIGLTWYILNSFYSWIFGFILLGLLECLNKHNGENILHYGFIAGLTHSLILAIFTAINCEKIFSDLVSSLEQFFGKAEKGQKKIFFETIKENIRYLLRISPTYFVAANAEFKQDRKMSDDSIKQIKQVKQKTKCIHTKKLNSLYMENINKLELRSATVKIKDKQLSNTPFMSANDNDLFYSDDDADVLEEVQQKNASLEKREDKDCFICCLNTPNAVFMNCGHGGVCYDCAIKAWKNSDNCVFCRQPVDEVLKVTLIEKINIAKVTEGTRRNEILVQA